MRPARIITAVVFAAAVAVTGCTAHSTTADPSTVPAAPVAAAPASPLPALAAPAPKPAVVAKQPVPKPPVLAGGRYDAYIRQVSSRSDYLVVDLVQVFHDQAAVEAAIADGKPRDTAQYLYIYIRNQNPRLRTLRLDSDLRLDLRGGDCEAPISNKLNTLAAHVRSGGWYYTLTVAGGAVQQITEQQASPAC
jgi:hypothetical protein